jgi:TRAP-type mannitol/chloroaromatic compound transport system permease large subunit
MGTVFSTVVMLVLMAIGIHVAGTMFVVGFAGAWFALGDAIVKHFGNQVWLVLNNFALTSIPLFILLGEMLLRSDITEKMYHSLSLWLSRLPGGLLHTNIGACALMAATSGSSVATAATLGVVAIPTMMAKGYNERMLLGSVCAGGTLGILIPPSINMIIYGSISTRPFASFFIAVSRIAVSFSGSRGDHYPSRSAAPSTKTSFTDAATVPVFRRRRSFAISKHLPGWATPTAAALGAFGNLVIAVLKKKVQSNFSTSLSIIVGDVHDSFPSWSPPSFELRIRSSLPQLFTECSMSFGLSPG